MVAKEHLFVCHQKQSGADVQGFHGGKPTCQPCLHSVFMIPVGPMQRSRDTFQKTVMVRALGVCWVSSVSMTNKPAQKATVKKMNVGCSSTSMTTASVLDIHFLEEAICQDLSTRHICRCMLVYWVWHARFESYLHLAVAVQHRPAFIYNLCLTCAYDPNHKQHFCRHVACPSAAPIPQLHSHQKPFASFAATEPAQNTSDSGTSSST